jgi:hypothetical protein
MHPSLQHLFSGKPTGEQHISVSGLAEIKRVLCNEPPFLGDERYLIFGSELHRRFLINTKHSRLTFAEEQSIKNMIDSLNKHKFVKSLMRNSIREVADFGIVHGARFKWIGDIVKQEKKIRIGADIKTTSVKNESEFVKLAIEKYDYLRQGWCYKQAGKLDEFYFIGIQKKEPYSVYILNTSDYETEERRQTHETKFLIDIFKEYGRPVTKRPPVGQPA